MPIIIPKSRVERDPILDAMKKAIHAVEAAQKAAYDDVRTSSTVCTEHLDAALAAVRDAQAWYGALRTEEKTNERLDPIAKPKPAAKPECHVCGDEIEPDELTICGGCDEPTCPNCVGENEVCVECEAEQD
jgi:hypothetical protein